MTVKGREGPRLPFDAGAAVKAHRIVKHGSGDGTVVHATDTATDKLIGVTDRPAAEGARVDVWLTDVATVEAGGAITRGDLVGSGADGKAVSVAPVEAASGDNHAHTGRRVIGIALASAAKGDLFPVRIAPGAGAA